MTKTSNKAYDINIVLVVSDEDLLIHPTLRSIEAAAQRLEVAHCQISIATNSNSLILQDYLEKQLPKTISMSYKIYKDTTASRAELLNVAIKKTHAVYTMIIDVGDLVSSNWLRDSYNFLRHHSSLVLHPEYQFAFGAKDRLQRIVGSSDEVFNPRVLAKEDSLGSVIMARTTTFVQVPFVTTGGKQEAWLWNMDTLSVGHEHAVTPGTLYAKRWHNNQTKVLLPASAFLRTSPKSLIQPDQVSEESVIIDAKVDKRLRFARESIERIHNSRVTRKMRMIHPRLESFAHSMRNESLHLFRPVKTSSQHFIPDWIGVTLDELHEIDYAVFLSNYLKRHIELYRPIANVFVEAYWQIVSDVGEHVDILVIIPYLKHGGAEKELNSLLTIVLQKHPKAIIKIVTTSAEDSPGKANFDKRITFVHPPKQFFELNEIEQARLLATISAQLRPKKLHVINSVPGYKVIQRYGQIISQTTKIFLTIFMIDRTPEGRKTHVFTETIPESVAFINKVFTDNQTVARQLTDLTGIDASKFSVHYQPADMDRLRITKDRITQRFSEKPVKVLWASRLDRQKRPDILLRIAAEAKAQSLPIEFHIYGSSAVDTLDYISKFAAHDNMQFHGPFKGGLKTLPAKKYDIFLLTSEWEGMPNVLLEAITEAILVIAPDVGGIAELITDKKTGFLISEYDNIKSYVKAMKQAINNTKASQKIIRASQMEVMKKHSPEVYAAMIKREIDYRD